MFGQGFKQASEILARSSAVQPEPPVVALENPLIQS
jgi:hypothetical protein